MAGHMSASLGFRPSRIGFARVKGLRTAIAKATAGRIMSRWRYGAGNGFGRVRCAIQFGERVQQAARIGMLGVFQ